MKLYVHSLADKLKGTGLFPGVKRPGRGVDHPLPYSAEVKIKSTVIPRLTSDPANDFFE